VTGATLGEPRARRAPRATARRRWLLAGLGVLLLAALLIGVDRAGGRGGGPNFDAVPDILRAGAATLALFAACGYAPARLLTPAVMRPHLPLIVVPLGAAVAGLVLTLLGVFAVPLPVSLVLVMGAGVVGGLLSHRRPVAAASPPGTDMGTRVLGPAAIALAVAALLASPLVRPDSFATVLGQNGDAHLATGTAEFLQHHHPSATDTALPVDKVPYPWRSKLPIYYALAGASALSGLDPIQAFATVSAIVAALVPIGFALVAVYVFGVGPAAALAATALVAADRILFRVTLDPFYNQLWGLFALPFLLLFGWRYLREPSRQSFVLLVVFAALAVFAYPLLMPFPAVFLGVTGWFAWRRARARGERPRWLSALRVPTGRRWLLLYVPAGIVFVPLLLILLASALDKAVAAFAAALPGGDLSAWSGKDLGYFPVHHFLGLPDAAGFLVIAVLAFAAVGLARIDREAALAVGAMLAALVVVATWFRLRGQGELFHFRTLGFFGVTLVSLAGVGLAAALGAARPLARAAGAAGAAALVLPMLVNVRDALADTFPHVTREVWQLRSWSDRLPAGASVRVDVSPRGVQQWAAYMLADHPVTASDPQRDFFPYPPVGRKADYLLVNRPPRRPGDAAGSPLLSNRRFELYRMRADVPGRDRSSRRLVDPFETGEAKQSGD